MCTVIEVDGVPCETRGELEAAIGGEAMRVSGYAPDALWPDYACLCPCDSEATAAKYGYRIGRGDPFVEVWTRMYRQGGVQLSREALSKLRASSTAPADADDAQKEM